MAQQFSTDQLESLRRRLADGISPEPMTGCWLWAKSCGSSGYGKLRVGNKDISTHRASFLAFRGQIGDGMCVLHSCDVKLCVNPAHLFVGSHSDNSKDMVKKGRHKCPARNRAFCPRGHLYSGLNSFGRRICHSCANEASKRWNLKNRKSS